MDLALQEANLAYGRGEVPVGCVIVHPKTGEVIASSANMMQNHKNPILHAEIVAITKACRKVDNKNLLDCDIYITLEPCAMCCAAIANARLGKIYYGASDAKHGAVENGVRFFTTKSCFHRPEIYSGIREKESIELMQSFFRNIRKSKL